jgi:hypothetical protein
MSPSTARRRAPSRWRIRRRAVSRVSLCGPRFVGDAEALVEVKMEVKLKGTESGRERRRSRLARAKKGGGPSTGREDRRRGKGACARVS